MQTQSSANVQENNNNNADMDFLGQYVIRPQSKAYSIYIDPLISAGKIAAYNKFQRRFALDKICTYFMGKNAGNWLSAVKNVWAYWQIGIYDLLRCEGDKYVRSSVATWLTLHDAESCHLTFPNVITSREVIDNITFRLAPADHPYRVNLTDSMNSQTHTSAETPI